MPVSIPAGDDWETRARIKAEVAQDLKKTTRQASSHLFFYTIAPDEGDRIQECIDFMSDAADKVPSRGFPQTMSTRWG